MFSVGDRVLCIDDSTIPEIQELLDNHPIKWIEKDKEYTIRHIFDNDGIATGLLLEEIINPPFYIPLLGRVQEFAFAEFRFRKLTSVVQKSEIEMEEKICI